MSLFYYKIKITQKSYKYQSWVKYIKLGNTLYISIIGYVIAKKYFVSYITQKCKNNLLSFKLMQNGGNLTHIHIATYMNNLYMYRRKMICELYFTKENMRRKKDASIF